MYRIVAPTTKRKKITLPPPGSVTADASEWCSIFCQDLMWSSPDAGGTPRQLLIAQYACLRNACACERFASGETGQ